MRKLWVFLILFCALALSAQVSVTVRTSTAPARKSPDTHAKILATLHEGESFIVKDDVPYWYQIVLRNGNKAWVRKAACTVIGPDDVEEPSPDTPPALPPTPTGPPVTPPSCTPMVIPADWSICPQSGKGVKYRQAYLEKNRVDIPCSYTPMTLAEIRGLQQLPNTVRALPDGDPQLFYLKQMESMPVVVDAYVAMTKDGGKEGVNCGSSTRLDTHVELVDSDAADPKDNRNTHVVVEVTPWFRNTFPNWTTAKIGESASYIGGYSAHSPAHPPGEIRIYGYLFYDEAHATGASTWRGTAWEIHPITKIEILENGAWTELK